VQFSRQSCSTANIVRNRMLDVTLCSSADRAGNHGQDTVFSDMGEDGRGIRRE
jgi:hypothetical protein